jgi:hypothetical protein
VNDKKTVPKRPQSAAGSRTMPNKKKAPELSEKEILLQVVLQPWNSPDSAAPAEQRRAGSASRAAPANTSNIDAKLVDMAKKIRDEKYVIETVMYLVYDMKSQKMGNSAFQYRSGSRSRPQSAKAQKDKDSFSFTNDKNEIKEIYEKNKQRARETISGGPGLVAKIVDDFFGNDNTILRLELYRHYVNKSKRKGSVPLLQFYINMLSEERLIHMVEKATDETVEVAGRPRQNADGEIVESTVKYRMPADHYQIQQYEERQKQKAEDAERQRQENHHKKLAEQKRRALQAVFGDSYKPTADDVDPLRGI